MPSVKKALVLTLVLVLTIANAAYSYSWDEAGERYLRSSGRGRTSRASSGNVGGSYSNTSSGGFSRGRYSGYKGTFNYDGNYFYFGYYAYRTTYVYANYSDGDRCFPEDLECLEDARLRERDTKIHVHRHRTRPVSLFAFGEIVNGETADEHKVIVVAAQSRPNRQ